MVLYICYLPSTSKTVRTEHSPTDFQPRDTLPQTSQPIEACSMQQPHYFPGSPILPVRSGVLRVNSQAAIVSFCCERADLAKITAGVLHVRVDVVKLGTGPPSRRKGGNVSVAQEILTYRVYAMV